MTSTFSAEQLSKIRKNKHDIHRETYKTLYKECMNRITRANENGRTNVTYDIPAISLGLPLYDIHHVSAYIVRKLTEGNFRTLMIAINKIYIDWDHVVNKSIGHGTVETKERPRGSHYVSL